MHTAENLIYLKKSAPRYSRMPCAWDDKSHDYFTPREISRLVPWLTRGELTRRRNDGLAPKFELISGCVMYRQLDVLEFLAANNLSATGSGRSEESSDYPEVTEFHLVCSQ